MSESLNISKDDRLLLRLASIDDRDDLLNWRNNPRVVMFTRIQSTISAQEHNYWLTNRLTVLDTEPILIFTKGRNKVGMTRLDFIDSQERTYEISIVVDERYQNQGLGKSMLRRSCEFAMTELSTTNIQAVIHKDNLSSIHLFCNLGFEINSQEDDSFYVYRLES